MRKMLLPFFIIALVVVLSGCASSQASRTAAANIDFGVHNAKNLIDRAADSNFAEAYQNSSQRTKGIILGGTAGAVTGAFASGIGIVPATAMGAMLGGSYGAYIDAHTTFQDQLENRRVTTVVLGDQILIVLASGHLFESGTDRLSPQGYSTLDLVTRYINQYTTMLVKVAAYTDDIGSKRANLALSHKQAEQVSKYLLKSGLNARLLYAQGYGSQHLVEASCMDSCKFSSNDRIEISLEKFRV